MDKAMRDLLLLSSQTVRLDGGDFYLARELMRQVAHGSLEDMVKLRGEPRAFMDAAFRTARDYMQCRDWDDMRLVLHLVDEVVSECGEEADRACARDLMGIANFRKAVDARSQRRVLLLERRMKWRNEVTKDPLRREWNAHHSLRPKRSRHFYRVHSRINERAEYAAGGE